MMKKLKKQRTGDPETPKRVEPIRNKAQMMDFFKKNDVVSPRTPIKSEALSKNAQCMRSYERQKKFEIIAGHLLPDLQCRRLEFRCNETSNYEKNLPDAASALPCWAAKRRRSKLQECCNKKSRTCDVPAPSTPDYATRKCLKRMIPQMKSEQPAKLLVYQRREKLKYQVELKEKTKKKRKLLCKNSFSATSKQGLKMRVQRVMNRPVVKLKHQGRRMRKTKSLVCQDKRSSGLEQGTLVLYEGITHPRPNKESTTEVELDARTLKEWKLMMGELDSKAIGEEDEGQREWWEKENESFREQVASFISSMYLIQGGRRFSQWKGSVMDSIIAAYLTQNVNDTLSSFAFMSLAAKYPEDGAGENSSSVTSNGSSTTLRKHKKAPFPSGSKQKNDKLLLRKASVSGTSNEKITNAPRNKRVKKGKSEEVEHTYLESQSNYRRKELKMEPDAINWERLKRLYYKGGNGKHSSDLKSCDTSDTLNWAKVRMAEVNDISKAIEIRGMNNNLAARIKNCLNILYRELGSTDLEWIRNVPPGKTKEYLLSIPGLGLKSVECIRLLTLHQKAFPIDRNAGRVAIRLGWVPLKPLAEGEEFHLLKKYPPVNSIQMYLWPRLSKLDPSALYELHCQMITFGKVFCTKKNPRCSACPMRAECKHYASALASVQLALQVLPEEDTKDSGDLFELAESLTVGEMAVVPLQQASSEASEFVSDLAAASGSKYYSSHHLQIVEVPARDALVSKESIGKDIEDFGANEIPQIIIDVEKLNQNIQKVISEKNVPPQEGKMSKALVVLASEIASAQMPKLKQEKRLRTEHQVYVLPDQHNLLAGLEQRDPNDPSPYLLSVWTLENLDMEEFKPDEETVYGTLLIPIRTAMRGGFPLNGTFFQANEVLADDESSEVPIRVQRASIWNLQRATLFCGVNITSVCRGMEIHEVQECFWRGFVCFKGFDRRTREPKPLSTRFHVPLCKLVQKSKHINKKKGEQKGIINKKTEMERNYNGS